MRAVNIRNIFLIILAVVAAGMTAIYARNWIMAERDALMRNAPTKIVQAATVEVLVADSNLTAGTFVKPKHLKWLAWPKNSLADEFVRKGQRTKMIRKMCRVSNALTAAVGGG